MRYKDYVIRRNKEQSKKIILETINNKLNILNLTKKTSDPYN